MRPCLFLLIAVPLSAQFDPFVAKNIPLLPKGRPDLKATTPKMADGRPDLNGVWWVFLKFDENDQSDERRAARFPISFSSIFMRPEAQQIFNQRVLGFKRTCLLQNVCHSGFH